MLLSLLQWLKAAETKLKRAFSSTQFSLDLDSEFSFLSVGARNFEEGMSIDGPLYAAISREIARSGEWFRLDARVPDFLPYNEHPHFAFWAQALIFKFLPAADWSARILGHLCYVLFLGLFFKRMSQFANEKKRPRSEFFFVDLGRLLKFLFHFLFRSSRTFDGGAWHSIFCGAHWLAKGKFFQ